MGKIGIILIMALAAALGYFFFLPNAIKSGQFLLNTDYSQVR